MAIQSVLGKVKLLHVVIDEVVLGLSTWTQQAVAMDVLGATGNAAPPAALLVPADSDMFSDAVIFLFGLDVA